MVENYLNRNNSNFSVFAVCLTSVTVKQGLFLTVWKLLSYKWLSRLLWVPWPPPTITWGPWIRDSQYEGQENMLPQQFKACAPGQQEVVTEREWCPFSLGSHILLKEKGGEGAGGGGRGSQFLGRLRRSPGSSRRRKGSGALKEEIGLWNSQGGGKDKCLFLFSLYNPSF